MYTYREQKELLSGIRLKEGQGRRIDCPFCGGRSTMYVSCRDGKKLWHCFRASCSTSGAEGVGRTLDGLKKAVSDLNTGRSLERRLPPMPKHLSNPRHHDEVMEYLQKNGCMVAFDRGWVTVRFEPAEKRVVFFLEDGSGAVGRSLTGARPKWKAYGDVSKLLRVGQGNTAVLVEDAASAASVARLPKCSGCALLGTRLTSIHKAQLREYERIIVALDKDATKKAVELKSRLEGVRPTKIAMLEQDMKFMTVAEMEDLI